MKNEKGQSLLEVTVAFVAVLMILAGILDLGRLYYTSIAMEDAAGEAVLYMSINPNCVQEGVGCEYPDNAISRAKEASHGKIANLEDATVTIKCFDVNNNEEDCKNGTPGDLISVSIDYNYVFLAPFIPEINGAPSIDLHSEAQSLILVP